MALPYERVPLKRGSGYLVGTYIFVHATKARDIQYLKCQYYSAPHRCAARAKVTDNGIELIVPDHTHEPPSLDSLKFRAKVLDEAKKSVNCRSSLGLIYNNVRSETLSNSPNADIVLPQLQTYRSLERSMSRSRKGVLPAEPNNSQEIDIQFFLDNMKYPDNSDFFLCDSGPNDPKRILIFGSKDSDLRRLSESDTWYMDGTFWVVPHVFYQLFTVHAYVYGQQFPFLYCLLPDKTELTYQKLFVMIQNIFRERNLPLSALKSVVTDFEPAIANAFRRVFPYISSLGCFFHYSQAIYRKVQTDGLSLAYKEDANFRRSVKLLIALGLVPSQYKYHYFCYIYADSTDPRFRQFCNDYFFPTWFRRFPVTSWDWFQQPRRTNNGCEGWHARIKRFFAAPHLKVYRFSQILFAEAKKNCSDLSLRLQGEPLPPRKPIYDQIDRRFATLYTEFAVRAPIDYLAGFISGMPTADYEED